MSRQHKSKGNCNKTQRVATNKPKVKTFAAPVAAAAESDRARVKARCKAGGRASERENTA